MNNNYYEPNTIFVILVCFLYLTVRVVQMFTAFKKSPKGNKTWLKLCLSFYCLSIFLCLDYFFGSITLIYGEELTFCKIPTLWKLFIIGVFTITLGRTDLYKSFARNAVNPEIKKADNDKN